MRPLKHLIYSATAASVLLLETKSTKVAAGCLATGIFVDLDHLIEYYKYCEGDWKWNEFLTGCYFDDKGTVKVIFHSWEMAAVMWCSILVKGKAKADRQSPLYGIAVGYTLHLILDQIGNNLSGLGYFELYRWLVDWKQNKLAVR